MTDVAEIEGKVINSIKLFANEMGGNNISITKETRFFEDLGFVVEMRRELAKEMSIISTSYGGVRISKDEAGKLKKVADACKLVVKKISLICYE